MRGPRLFGRYPSTSRHYAAKATVPREGADPRSPDSPDRKPKRRRLASASWPKSLKVGCQLAWQILVNLELHDALSGSRHSAYANSAAYAKDAWTDKTC
jgi:hypothetical protein